MFRPLDFKGVIPVDSFPKDGMLDFALAFRGFYEDGKGYKNDECRRSFRVFKASLRANLDKIIQHPHNGCTVHYEDGDEVRGYCDTVMEYDITGKRNQLMYLHPERIDGYLYQDDIERLQKFTEDYFKRFNINASTELLYARPTVCMSDTEYQNLLYEHVADILNVVKEAYNNLTPAEKERYGKVFFNSDNGFDFAKTCRIPREFDGSGFSCFDTDIRTVNLMITQAMKTGYFGDLDLGGHNL